MAAAGAMSLAAGPASAFPDGPVDPVWLDHDAASRRTVDHAPWAAFLAAFRVSGPDGIALVRYGAAGPDALAALDAYIAALGAVPVAGLSRDGQFAFWVNLYNAVTVALVLRRWPVASIRDIGGGLFSPGPWGEPLVEVGGRALSLDDIEHGILRPIWRDPRIHYAVNCASLGCPDLGAVPFAPDGIEAQLDAAARAYVNHPRGARLDARGRLVVSSIYRWYAEDFGDGDDASVIAHLRRHAEPPLAAALADIGEIHDDAYDWRINDAPG